MLLFETLAQPVKLKWGVLFPLTRAKGFTSSFHSSWTISCEALLHCCQSMLGWGIPLEATHNDRRQRRLISPWFLRPSISNNIQIQSLEWCKRTKLETGSLRNQAPYLWFCHRWWLREDCGDFPWGLAGGGGTLQWCQGAALSPTGPICCDTVESTGKAEAIPIPGLSSVDNLRGQLIWLIWTGMLEAPSRVGQSQIPLCSPYLHTHTSMCACAYTHMHACTHAHKRRS